MSTDKILTATYLTKAMRKKIEAIAKKEHTTISRVIFLMVEKGLADREKSRDGSS